MALTGVFTKSTTSTVASTVTSTVTSSGTSATTSRAATGDAAASDAATADAVASAAVAAPALKPVPVWFFAFEGVTGACYDLVKTSSYGWTVVALAVGANIVLARTGLRGLRMARAMFRSARTRKVAVALVALRVGAHFALGAIGVAATSRPAHLAFAAVMCATTIALLTYEQKVVLRALGTR